MNNHISCHWQELLLLCYSYNFQFVFTNDASPCFALLKEAPSVTMTLQTHVDTEIYEEIWYIHFFHVVYVMETYCIDN